MAQPIGRRVEQQTGHRAAVRDLDPHRPEPPADVGERVELCVLQELLAPACARTRDPAQQGRVPRGHGPPQQRAQPLEGAYVARVVRGDRQGERVHGRAPAQGAAHDDEGRQAGPSTSSTRPSRWAKSTGRASSISGSQASSALTASRATVSGASRTP